MLDTDHDRPYTMPGPDIMTPDTMSPPGAPDRAEPKSPTTDGANNDDGNANAPRAQRRADHDRHERADDHPPLSIRPHTPPAIAPSRAMPIVPVGSLGRIVRTDPP